MKHKGDSFTKVILKVTEKEQRRPLTDFFGALGEESADAIEKAIQEGRKKHLELHLKRPQNVA